MSVFIPRWEKFKEKPRGTAFEIDFSNYFAEFLTLHCATLAVKDGWTVGGNPVETDYIKFNGSIDYIESNGGLFTGTGFTLFLNISDINPAASQQWGRFAGISEYNSTSGVGFSFELHGNTGNTDAAIEFYQSTTASNLIDVGAATTLHDSTCTITMGSTNGLRKAYVDNTRKINLTGFPVLVGTDHLNIGRRPAGEYGNFSMKNAYAFDKELDVDEIALLNENPWQLYKKRRLFFLLSATPGIGIIGQTAESDSPFAVAASKLRDVGQAIEADSGLLVAQKKTAAVGEALELDAALTSARAKSMAAGQAVETDFSQAFSSSIIVLINFAVEADQAQAPARLKIMPAGLAAESDTAQLHGRLKSLSSGQAVESDTAQPLGSVIVQLIGSASELDAAKALQGSKLKGIGQVGESDSASSMVGGIAVSIGFPAEKDSAQLADRVKTALLALVAENDAGIALQAEKIAAVGLVSEADIAQQLGALKSLLLLPASEVDIAMPGQGPIEIPVGIVQENDTALNLISTLVGLGVIESPSVFSVSIRRHVKVLH